MSTDPSLSLGEHETPSWVRGATRGQALMRGVLVAVGPPGLILAVSSAGFGALARDAGWSLELALFTMGTYFALPAQVVLADQLARGTALSAAALAVCLSSLRLLPMTVTILPHLRSGQREASRTRRWLSRLAVLLAVHFVAVTAWVEGMRRLPVLPAHLKLPHFLGLGVGLVIMTMFGTGLGYHISAGAPLWLSATFLFMSPIYFLLSLIDTARVRADWIAIVLGLTLGPVFYQLAPDIDLLLAGLIGGTLAYLVGKTVRSTSDQSTKADRPS